MTKAQFRGMQTSIDIPGVDKNFLIEPEFLASRQWGIWCIPDRLTFHQIGILIEPKPEYFSRIFGAFDTDSEVIALDFDRSITAIGAFFAEMVGGNACIFDLPTNFLISVLEGDITLVAANHADLQNTFGIRSEMTRPDWIEISREVRQDISDKILGKYVATR